MARCKKHNTEMDDIWGCGTCSVEDGDLRRAAPVLERRVKENPYVNINPKWISVKEKLPEDYKPVLAYDGHNMCVYYHIDGKHGWPDNPHWTHGKHRVGDGEVTHWMPLPKEPTKEKEKHPLEQQMPPQDRNTY